VASNFSPWCFSPSLSLQRPRITLAARASRANLVAAPETACLASGQVSAVTPLARFPATPSGNATQVLVLSGVLRPNFL